MGRAGPRAGARATAASPIYRRSANGAARSDVPTELVAITRATYDPGRRLRAARRRVVPGERLRPRLQARRRQLRDDGAVLRLDLERDARRRARARSRPSARARRSAPSAPTACSRPGTAARRSDWRLWSSVAVTRQRHVPSASNADQVKRYVPGSREPESTGRAVPSGATSSAVTVDGRTTV